MIPQITQPTRITKSSATLIDNIIVSHNFCSNFIGSVLVNDMSDHLPTVCIINSLTAMTRGTVTITSRDTRPKNLKALRAQLHNHDWSKKLSDRSSSVNMEHVHNVLISTVDRCIPINPKRLRKEPWLTPGIKKSIDRNKKLHAKMLRKDVDSNTYKDYNKSLRKIIRTAKRNYYHDKCAEFKCQTKKLWGLINEISGKKSDKSTLIEYL